MDTVSIIARTRSKYFDILYNKFMKQVTLVTVYVE